MIRCADPTLSPARKRIRARACTSLCLSARESAPPPCGCGAPAYVVLRYCFSCTPADDARHSQSCAGGCEAFSRASAPARRTNMCMLWSSSGVKGPGSPGSGVHVSCLFVRRVPLCSCKPLFGLARVLLAVYIYQLITVHYLKRFSSSRRHPSLHWWRIKASP